MINMYYVYCNDIDLQEITKTEVVGLQKLKYPVFLCLTFTNPLCRKLTHPICHVCNYQNLRWNLQSKTGSKHRRCSSWISCSLHLTICLCLEVLWYSTHIDKIKKDVLYLYFIWVFPRTTARDFATLVCINFNVIIYLKDTAMETVVFVVSSKQFKGKPYRFNEQLQDNLIIKTPYQSS